MRPTRETRILNLMSRVSVACGAVARYLDRYNLSLLAAVFSGLQEGIGRAVYEAESVNS